jgi:circadian clock protein KaiB
MDSRAGAEVRKRAHQLSLYVAGSSPRSLRAIQNLKRICECDLAGRYNLEVVDIYKEPRRATEDQVVAIPTLIKRAPGVVRRMIGDLSETAILRQGLGL